MYSIIDSLIFPAPNSSYTKESLKDHLVYIPKFKNINLNQLFLDRDQTINYSENICGHSITNISSLDK